MGRFFKARLPAPHPAGDDRLFKRHRCLLNIPFGVSRRQHPTRGTHYIHAVKAQMALVLVDQLCRHALEPLRITGMKILPARSPRTLSGSVSK